MSDLQSEGKDIGAWSTLNPGSSGLRCEGARFPDLRPFTVHRSSLIIYNLLAVQVEENLRPTHLDTPPDDAAREDSSATGILVNTRGGQHPSDKVLLRDQRRLPSDNALDEPVIPRIS